MKYLQRFLTCFLFIHVFGFTAVAQQNPPFYKEIDAFKKADAINPPPKNAILFVGSSSFRGWKDVQSYFPGYTIINRGFGGSKLPDAIRYAKDIITPYQPKQVVIYCGENDFPVDSASAGVVFERFKTLFRIIRTDLPKTHILFVSFKPSPKQWKFVPEMVKGNKMIEDYLKTKRRTAYVDIHSKMLLPDGTPVPELYLADKLHMTPAGYKIWQKEIEPKLLK